MTAIASSTKVTRQMFQPDPQCRVTGLLKGSGCSSFLCQNGSSDETITKMPSTSLCGVWALLFVERLRCTQHTEKQRQNPWLFHAKFLTRMHVGRLMPALRRNRLACRQTVPGLSACTSRAPVVLPPLPSRAPSPLPRPYWVRTDKIRLFCRGDGTMLN